MAKSNFSVVVMAAGLGTRMKSDLPKALHKVAGREMVGHVVDAFSAAKPDHIVVVKAPNDTVMDDIVAPHKTVVQKERLGTGHAARIGIEALPKNYTGHVIVTVADMPLIKPETVMALSKALAKKEFGVAVLAFRPDDALRYGRLITTTDGQLLKIVEYKDASPAERRVNLCNSGVIAIDGKNAREWVNAIDNKNAASEFYLTDVVEIALKNKFKATFVETDEDEVSAANTRAELAHLERLMQKRLRDKAMLDGVTMMDPDTVHLSWDTKLGKDVMIEPNVFFGQGVTIGGGVHIKAFSHLEGAVVKSGAVIGPFARLRPEAVIGQDARVGNFVEVKKAKLGKGAKANHLSYIGDAEVGAKANIGAGTITCNYNGYFKDKTIIGKGAFIGSNTALVAPVTVGDGAMVGAGSTITKDVKADALSLTRARQKTYKKWAAKFHAVMAKRKEESKK